MSDRQKETGASPVESGGRIDDNPDHWTLRLYVAGLTPRSITAFGNLKRLCETHLTGKYTIEVIDLIDHPERARDDQILAIPTLVRKLPEPVRRIIGDLANTERVLIGLELLPGPDDVAGPFTEGANERP